MNIIEAIKSGKPFKRATWTNYMETNGSQLVWSTGGLEVCLGPDHILADNWELKPDAPVTITARQFWDAYQDFLNCNFPGAHYLMNYMAKKLGLEK